VTADSFIKLGFWSQILFLGLVDWGTLVAFSNEPPAWQHWLAFGVVNVVLLATAVVVWRWLRERRSLPPDQRPND